MENMARKILCRCFRGGGGGGGRSPISPPRRSASGRRADGDAADERDDAAHPDHGVAQAHPQPKHLLQPHWPHLVARLLQVEHQMLAIVVKSISILSDAGLGMAMFSLGSAAPNDQATSTEGDSRNGEFGRWQKNQCSTDGSSGSTSKSGYSKAFGVDLSPDNVAVATVYFVQGVLGLSRLAVSFYLKDDLQLDPAETAVITGFSALPWLVKPLYGFIRRSYLILSGILGAISWSFMATIVDDNTNKLTILYKVVRMTTLFA
ncbi:hypothetical protein ACQ4PT_054139 [Festuca glaucescens]